MSRETIKEHEGMKYLRIIQPAYPAPQYKGIQIWVDIYCVLDAFNIPCHATGHAIKKLLMAGERGKGTRLEDLKGALAAVNRAIDMEEIACGKEEYPKAEINKEAFLKP